MTQQVGVVNCFGRGFGVGRGFNATEWLKSASAQM